MTREQILDALDIAPDPSPASLDLDDGFTGQAPTGPPTSPTALDLDAWSLRRGKESLKGDILQPILSEISEEDPDTAALVAADCLAAAFEPDPRLAENPADKTRGRYFRQLLETEAYQALHAETRLDVTASELAAGHFAQGYCLLRQKQEEEKAQEGPQEDTEGQKGTDESRELKKDLQALSAASQALRRATQDVDDLRNAQRALGDDPSSPRALDPEALKARFDLIRKSSLLRAIIEAAGRYRRLAQAKQRQKVRHGQDDMVGVELGADLGRLLPSELAALGDEDLELDALRRYLERGLMQRDYRGVERKARGPVVVVVDESGSMSGPRIITAKATALAMAWIARHQGRYCCLVGFADDPEGTWCILRPGENSDDPLIAWLQHMYRGGTSPAVPLETVPARWNDIGAPHGQTDLILITDGIMNVKDDLGARFRAWKSQEKVTLYTLIVGERSPGDLAAVSDRWWCVPDLGIDQSAIQEIVSI